jgi:hypothetical protein
VDEVSDRVWARWRRRCRDEEGREEEGREEKVSTRRAGGKEGDV